MIHAFVVAYLDAAGACCIAGFGSYAVAQNFVKAMEIQEYVITRCEVLAPIAASEGA